MRGGKRGREKGEEGVGGGRGEKNWEGGKRRKILRAQSERHYENRDKGAGVADN